MHLMDLQETQEVVNEDGNAEEALVFGSQLATGTVLFGHQRPVNVPDDISHPQR
jgi:hypothetical protein